MGLSLRSRGTSPPRRTRGHLGSTGPPGLEPGEVADTEQAGRVGEPGELTTGLGGTEIALAPGEGRLEGAVPQPDTQHPQPYTLHPPPEEEGEEAMDTEEDGEGIVRVSGAGEGEWGSSVGGGPRGGEPADTDGTSQPTSETSGGGATAEESATSLQTASKVVARLTKSSGPQSSGPQLTSLLTSCPSLDVLRVLVDARIPTLNALQIGVAFKTLTKLVGARGTGLEQDGRVIARLLLTT